MVNAIKGEHKIRVSKHSYDSIFKNKGYRIIGEPEQRNNYVMDDTETEGENIPDEMETEEIDTIPVSEMNKEQLMEYAKEHNIDTSGARNVREARQIVQKAIRDSKM